MPSKAKKKILDRQRELQGQGWDWDVSNFHGVNPHTGEETCRHYLLKAEVCRQIANEGSRFITEAKHPERGIADVLDLKPEDPAAVVIEIETGVDREGRIAKAKQYTGERVRDAAVIDPLEAPENVDEWAEWVRGKLL